MHILKLMWRAVTSFVLTKKEKKKEEISFNLDHIGW
jgi:hypothetical protein